MAGGTRQSGATLEPSAPDVQQQFARLEGQFQTLKAQVRQVQQLSSLGTAAAMIAHEVSNLLTPILAYAQTAQSSGDPELMKRALSVTARNVQILISMSERLLAISAARATSPQVVAVRQIVEEAAASLCRDLSKDGITFAVDVDPGCTILADPLQMQQVLFNLFLNAREVMAASRSGRLTVSSRRQNDRVILRVANTGEPIPPDWLPHVFDPLQSSKAAAGSASPRCSGLGLALCRDLVEENGGTITAASDPQRGTTFTIDLPAGESQP